MNDNFALDFSASGSLGSAAALNSIPSFLLLTSSVIPPGRSRSPMQHCHYAGASVLDCEFGSIARGFGMGAGPVKARTWGIIA